MGERETQAQLFLTLSILADVVGRESRRVVDDALLLALGEAGAALLVGGREAVLAGLLVDLVLVELGQLLGGGDVALVLEEALGEDEVDLLERAARGLGVQEVDDGEEDGVEDAEEQVRAEAVGARVAHQHRRDHDDEEVPQPVRHRRHGVGLRARLERVDLRRVQPGERQPRRAEERDVGEEADGRAARRRRRAGDQRPEREHHGQALADGADEEQLAAADALDGEPGRRGEDRVDDHVDAAEQERQVVRRADGRLEQDGEVVDDGVAARELLHHLRGGAEQQAPEVLGLPVGDEVLHRRDAAGVARGPDRLGDDGDLGADGLILAVRSVKSRQHRGCLLVSVLCQQPAGRLR